MAGWSVCYKYRNAATAANAELDKAKSKLNELSNELDNILTGVGSDFPTDGSFYIGVNMKIGDIKNTISNCQNEIEEMKNSSYKEAKRKDDIETEKNKAKYYASLRRRKSNG